MTNDGKSLGSDLIQNVLRKGADAADVVIIDNTKFRAEVRNGSVESLMESGSKGLGLRVFRGSRTALTYSSDFDPAQLEQLAETTLALAEMTGEDECNGIPDNAVGRVNIPDLQLFDASLAGIDPEQKIKLAKKAEACAFQIDPRIRRTEGAAYEDNLTHVTYINSIGFSEAYQTTNVSIMVIPQAEEKGERQTAYWYSADRFFENLQSPETIGTIAAQRALRKLGARKVPTQKAPVIFEPLTGRQFLGSIAGAVSGDAVYKKASFLADQLNMQVGHPGLTMYDSGIIPGRLGSRPFDAEGIETRETTVIENGILKHFLLDHYSANKLHMQTTANASRGIASSPSVSINNFCLKAGTATPEDIIHSVPNGLYVTDLMGHGVNTVTGQFSQGASGLWIENGRLSYPVQGITIAGTMQDMLQGLSLIGNDLDTASAIMCPTFKIDSMIISGT